MKVFSLLSFLAFSAVSAAPAHYQDILKVAAYFQAVNLPGDDYTGGSSIFPGRVIGGFGTAASRFANADDWGVYILGKCAATPNCVGTSSYSNTMDTGERVWTGFIYSGSSLTSSDFAKADATRGIMGARAYTL